MATEAKGNVGIDRDAACGNIVGRGGPIGWGGSREVGCIRGEDAWQHIQMRVGASEDHNNKRGSVRRLL